MGKSRISNSASITVRSSDGEDVKVSTAGVKLLVTDLELAKGEAFTFYLVADNKEYDFSDVTEIKLKESSSVQSADFKKITNRSFTLTSKAKTTEDTPEAITVQLVGANSETAEVTVNLTVKETNETINAMFTKTVVDAYPGSKLQIVLSGTDAETATIDSVTQEEGNITLDKASKTLAINSAGEFVQGIKLTKDSHTKTIYIQATSSDVITVDPTDVEIHMLQTAQLDIKLSGSDFNITSDKTEVCTVNKGNKTITPVAPGTAKVTVTGTRGELSQSKEVNVVVRETVYPTLPAIINQATSVNGGDKLILRVKVADGDTLSARIDGSDKGDLSVELNKLVYVAHTPNDDEVVTIKLKTTSSDDVESEEVDYPITVKGIPTTTLIVPEKVTLKEYQSMVLDITTDAKSVTLVPSLPALLSVNSSTKTIKANSVGTLSLTVKATAINMKPAEKVISVVIGPADLSRPILKTNVLQVESGKAIKLEFIISKNSLIDVKEATDAGIMEHYGNDNPNMVVWTAPDIGEYTTYPFNFVARSLREEYNLVSPDYTFQVLVVKPVDDSEPEKPDTGLSMGEVLSIVKDEKLGFKEKIDILKEQGNNKTIEILNVLLDYQEVMSQSESAIGEETGGAKNFELFSKLKYILELKDNGSFQALFGLVNLVFREYRDGAYAELKLHRFEDNWPSNSNMLTAYKGLVTAIYMLCDISTRESNMKRVDFNKVFDTELEVWNEYSVQSFTKYYTY